MKPIFKTFITTIIILLGCFITVNAQSRINAPNVGAKTDSLLVVGADRQAKNVPLSTLKTWVASDLDAADISLDDTDLVVVPVTDLQAFADGADAALLRARGTGVSTSYVSTVSVGGTTFAQPDVNGEINSDQGYFSISHTGATGISVNDLTASSTYVYVDNAGALQQQITTPTRQDWSRKMFTMRIGVNTSTNTIIGFEYLNNPIGHYANSIRDLYEYLLKQGIPFKSDQVITGRAGDLGFDVSAGTLMEFGGTGDINNANIRSYDAVANTAYNLMSRTALVSSETDLVKFWDNAGTITALGSTTLVGHRLYRFSSGNFAMQYGQGNYANMSLAKAGVLTEEYVLNPALKDATFFGWWFIESTATNTGGTTLTDFKEYTIGLQGGSSSSLSGALLKGNNLSDLLDVPQTLINLGVTALDAQNVKLTGDQSIAGEKTFEDRVIFGDNNNLQVYTDIDNVGLIHTGSGVAFISTENFTVMGSSNQEPKMIIAEEDAGVDLYYNNSKKLETTNTGIDITGDVTAVNGDFSGSLGVGTASPNTILEANGAITFSSIDTFGQFVVKSTSGALGELLNFGVDTVNGLSFIQSVDRGSASMPLSIQRYAGNTLFGTTTDNGNKVQVNGNISATDGIFSGNVTAVDGVFSGKLGVAGVTAPASALDVNGVVRASGSSISANGEGAELMYTTTNWWSGSGGLLQAYDRGGSAFKPFGVNGLSLHFSTSGNLKFSIANSGAATFVSSVSATDGIFSNDVTLEDNGKLLVGTDADLEIYHTGINSYFNPSAHQLGILDIGSTSNAWGQMRLNSSSYTFSDGVTTDFLQLSGAGNVDVPTGDLEVTLGDVTVGGNTYFGTTGTPNGTSIYGSAFTAESGDRSKLSMASSTTSAADLISFYNPNGLVGRIQAVTSGTNYYTSSDYRLKEDLKDFNGLEMISNIPVYNHKWKVDDSRSYSVLAHELQSVLPQAVSGQKDGEMIQGVDYSKVVPILIKAIQELKAEVELLKNK